MSPYAPLPNTLADRIEVWLAFEADATTHGLTDRLESLLSTEERTKQQRLHSARDRRRFLLTRALVRTVLSHHTGLDPREWQFVDTIHGRPAVSPEVIGRHPEAARLCFNISHTDGLVALGVCNERRLGIDVERVPLAADPDELAPHCLSSIERAELAQKPREQRLARFGEYWTFKEAYIKAIGMGLSMPLDRFSIHLDDTPRVAWSTHEPVHASPRWWFAQFRPSDRHMLALCAETIEGECPTIEWRRAIPAASAACFDLTPTKSSKAAPTA